MLSRRQQDLVNNVNNICQGSPLLFALYCMSWGKQSHMQGTNFAGQFADKTHFYLSRIFNAGLLLVKKCGYFYFSEVKVVNTPPVSSSLLRNCQIVLSSRV